MRWPRPGPGPIAAGHREQEEEGEGAHGRHGEEGIGGQVVLPREKWEVAGLKVAPAAQRTLAGTTFVTGKLTLNEDRVANIHSLVDGQVHEVRVQFGEDVRRRQTLAIIDSKEVGNAKLRWVQARLAAEFARVNNDWAQQINTNTQELMQALAAGSPLESIDKRFAGKPMGEYREKLITAYANLHKSRRDLQRLGRLAEQGVAAGKQALAAQAAYEADRAKFQALMEQLKFTARQQALMAEQRLREADQAVAAARSQLFILGYRQADLQRIDPIKEGEGISHYEIRAPFDGTVIEKRVVLAERVGPDTELFRIADLSTLWVQADIYQKDLPKIERLGDRLRFRAPPNLEEFDARIFYRGDILDPETRTVRLRAVVDNPDRRLKAGMFVDVALPGEAIPDALVVPASALQEIRGRTVVFVRHEDETFEVRGVDVGARSGGWVEIREGLRRGESVVVSGGFTLKSELLKASISHSH